MKEDPDKEKFDKSYKEFLHAENSKVHRKATEYLLSEVELDEEFRDILEQPENVKKFLLSLKEFAEEEEDPKERAGMKALGAVLESHYEHREFAELSSALFGLALRHIGEFIHLPEREDFEDLTDFDLYEKRLLPSEIFIQFFLLEILSHGETYNWNRNQEIITQSLACLIVCFGDIYEFLNAEGEEDIE